MEVSSPSWRGQLGATLQLVMGQSADVEWDILFVFVGVEAWRIGTYVTILRGYGKV